MTAKTQNKSKTLKKTEKIKSGKKQKPSVKNLKPRRPAQSFYTGIFSASIAGFGFVKPDLPGLPEFFIPGRYIGHAIDGDQVAFRELPGGNDNMGNHSNPVGEIVEILSHTRREIVAELTSRDRAKPMDKHLPESIRIKPGSRRIRTGEWVKLKLLQENEMPADAGHKKRKKALMGEILDSCGKAGVLSADLDAVCQEFDLPEPYTLSENREAEKLQPREIGREDCRHIFTVAIDPEDAHDFDDALSVLPGEKNGEMILGVHIADVAAFIKPGTKFDKKAEFRGFSSYIPCRFSPMLPASLTAKISLQKGKESLAHTLWFTIRKRDGKVLSSRRVHTRVQVNHSLSYEEVQQFLDFPRKSSFDRELKKNLKMLAGICQKLREQRDKTEQFLNLEIPEIRVLCHEESGELTGIQRRIQGPAEQLVEECMLLANSTVAEEIKQRGIAGLYRVHQEPDPEKIAEFSSWAAQSFQFHTGDILSGRTACRHFLESLPDDHRKPLLLSAFLRSLPRACYQADVDIHYGLGKNCYVHFTSPVRRYADLLLHQQLWIADTGGRLRSKNSLLATGNELSEKEIRNDDAFYAASDRLKLHYLQKLGIWDEDGTGRVLHEGVISKITAGGLVCYMTELGIFGFVPSHQIRGGTFQRSSRNRQQLKASRGHRSYQVGDIVYLHLDSVDLIRGTAFFTPAL